MIVLRNHNDIINYMLDNDLYVDYDMDVEQLAELLQGRNDIELDLDINRKPIEVKKDTLISYDVDETRELDDEMRKAIEKSKLEHAIEMDMMIKKERGVINKIKKEREKEKKRLDDLEQEELSEILKKSQEEYEMFQMNYKEDEFSNEKEKQGSNEQEQDENKQNTHIREYIAKLIEFLENKDIRGMRCYLETLDLPLMTKIYVLSHNGSNFKSQLKNVDKALTILKFNLDL